jgi:hypothetical protein
MPAMPTQDRQPPTQIPYRDGASDRSERVRRRRHRIAAARETVVVAVYGCFWLFYLALMIAGVYITVVKQEPAGLLLAVSMFLPLGLSTPDLYRRLKATQSGYGSSGEDSIAEQRARMVVPAHRRTLSPRRPKGDPAATVLPRPKHLPPTITATPATIASKRESARRWRILRLKDRIGRTGLLIANSSVALVCAIGYLIVFRPILFARLLAYFVTRH